MHRIPAIDTMPPRWRRLYGQCAHAMPRLRTLLMLLAVLVMVVKANGDPPQWLLQGTDSVLILVTACVIYAVLLAVPFVPSVEIGLLIMILFGVPGALGAYLATFAGLSGAYLIGRRAGDHGLLRRVSIPARQWRPLTRCAGVLPEGGLPALSLVALLNLPGNTVFGGGGGIAMAYGAGRLLTWPIFAATVALGTSILPLAFVTGLIGLEQWTMTG